MEKFENYIQINVATHSNCRDSLCSSCKH